MAQRNASELIAGAVVLIVAVGFLGYAVAHTGRGDGSGVTLHARFDRIDGLSVGSDVRMAGVKIGSVIKTAIDPTTYQALVDFTVRRDLKVPKDSSAQITSSGLLGGEFLALVPGGDEAMVPPGGDIAITQSAVSLEDLLGKFIFNVADLSSNVRKQLQQEQRGQTGGGAPAQTPASPPALAPLR